MIPPQSSPLTFRIAQRALTRFRLDKKKNNKIKNRQQTEDNIVNLDPKWGAK
jgi:hypothetical protein